MRLYLLPFFVLVGLATIFSGVVSLLARARLADVPQRRLLVSGLLRIVVGVVALAPPVREIANPS